MDLRSCLVPLAAVALVVTCSCAPRHACREIQQPRQAPTRELPGDLVIKIISTPHQYAPGHYEFGLTADGQAVLIPMLSIGEPQRWHVDADSVQRAVSFLMDAGFGEVDAFKECLPGTEILHVGVRLDARRLSRPKAETRKKQSERDLSDLVVELRAILGIDLVLQRLEEEARATASRRTVGSGGR